MLPIPELVADDLASIKNYSCGSLKGHPAIPQRPPSEGERGEHSPGREQASLPASEYFSWPITVLLDSSPGSGSCRGTDISSRTLLFALWARYYIDADDRSPPRAFESRLIQIIAVIIAAQ